MVAGCLETQKLTVSACELRREDDSDSSSEGGCTVAKVPFLRQLLFLQREVGFGVLYIGVACFFFQVSGELLPRAATDYVFKSRHVDAERVQHYGIYFSVTEVFKIVYGMLSSVFPLWGLTMKPYAAPGILVMVGCNVLVFCLQDSLPVDQFVAARFFTWGAINYLNLITDVCVAKKRNEKPEVGPALYSFFSYSDLLRTALLAVVAARLIQWHVYAAFGVAAVVSLSLVPAVAFDLYPERRMTPDEAEARRASILSDSDILFFSLALIGVAAYTLCVATALSAHPYLQCCAVQLGMAALCLCWYGFANSDMAALIVYFVLGSSAQPNISSAVFYFYTDEEDIYPDGPHFTPFFMVTVVPLLGTVLSFAGVTIYNACMSEWNFRSVVRIPLYTRMALHFVDVLMFSRWNVRNGIPDWLFVFGMHALGDTLQACEMIVYRQIVARLCPPGLEAAVLSLFWFSQSLTGAGNGSVSVAFCHMFGVSPNGTAGDEGAFGNMWLLSVLSGLGVFVQLALVHFAIPGVPQTQRVDRVRAWNDGSLYSRYFPKCAKTAS